MQASTSRKALSLAQAPGDVLVEIAGYLDSRMDVFNFCLTNNRVLTNVSSILYAVVVLTSAEQCANTLSMLTRRPDIARHVRELIVRPGLPSTSPSYKKAKRQAFFDSLVASAAVRTAVMSFTLDALSRFMWDCDELPYFDDMWFALRVCCPRLKYISTSLGSIIPAVNSHLFDFNDLRGFTFFLKEGFYTNHSDTFFEDEPPETRRFWDMLIERCPNLEELGIEGVSTFPADVHQLLEGRWPKLKKLVLGDVTLESLRSLQPGFTTNRSPVIDFLEAHPGIEELRLSRASVDHNQLSFLSQPSISFSTQESAESSLPLTKLHTFSGTLEQLQSITSSHPTLLSTLESVTFRESMQTRDVTSLVVAGLLGRLTKLRKLKVAFELHSMYDSGNLLKSLIGSCPELVDLELVCGRRPSFQIDAFSKSIRGFTKLRALHLSIVRYPGDENLASGAARIALANPRLEKFTLTFLPMKCPISFPFPFTVNLGGDSGMGSMLGMLGGGRSKASGSFTLTCDKHGLPVTLRAFERRRWVWPMGLGSTYKTRRYVSDLRPPGSPSRAREKQGGLKGLMELMGESSAAGEELRMLAFCAFLVCLALWGFLVNRLRG